jgi:hypothetical protein
MGLLAEGLATADAGHRPAFLESSNPVNTPRYERYGFERVGSFTYAGTDATDTTEVTTMWRPAR